MGRGLLLALLMAPLIGFSGAGPHLPSTSVPEPDSAEPCQVQVILFLPADAPAPGPNVEARIREIVAAADAFFLRGLERWGHRGLVSPFRRDADGQFEIRQVRGKRKAAGYKPVELRAEVMDLLRAEKRIPGPKQVWWIMVWPGDPPARFEGFLGGFGEDIGGWATANLDTSPGRIDPAAPLGEELAVELMIKGMVHELGHGLGLPHIGPREADKSGNTLMGPTHINYRRVRGAGEERVYLSEASAAILSRHPAFRGVPDERGALPKLELADMRYSANARRSEMLVRGRVISAERAVWALVADESDARPGEYWTKTYVGEVDEDGTFVVKVTEPAQAGGALRIWFVFEDGDHTGDGRKRSRPSGVEKKYRWDGRTWRFE